MKTYAPGWILMTKEVMKRFSLEDLNLTNGELVAKYWEPYNIPAHVYYSKLLPMALRLCITKNLAYERV